MADTQTVRLDGSTRATVLATTASLCGLYRLYVATADQVEAANLSAVEGLVTVYRVGGVLAVEACLSMVTRQLVSSGFPPQDIVSWTVRLTLATAHW